MISFLGGLWAGFISQFVWLGYAVVEAIILQIAFNAFMPFMIETFSLSFPLFHLSFSMSLAFLVLINIVGKIIYKLSPKIVTIKNDQNTENNN